MLNEAGTTSTDIIPDARNQVRAGSLPNWITESSFDSQFKPESTGPITYLLLDTQIHAERQEVFIHQAIRLESMEAVQHWSQWRLQFEPKTQLLTLHSLTIHRGEAVINHLDVGKAHYLQREEGLERFVIHGWFTFLIVLDDVQPGDILEFSYTTQSIPRLLPEHNSHFFTLPLAIPVGKYRFALRFNVARQMKWKSSTTDLKPNEREEDGVMHWEWLGEKHTSPKPDANAPSWHISSPWVQISAFPSWQTIATAVAKTWATDFGDGVIVEMAKEIEAKHLDLPSRIEAAIQLIRDKFRYLSVNLELGGYVPTAPDIVARRRFGDCKDLSYLLVNLLKKLGMQARPILVNTFLKKSIGDLLPTPALFDHAIIEFEADGKKRWIDTTLKEQGGGPFNRTIPDYGLGLPVDPAGEGFVKPPEISKQSNLFELRENILLDTCGAPSLLAITLQGEGGQADLLRQELAHMGVEEMSRKRLEVVVNRFGNAKRIGSLKHQDDREANRFILAEAFEIKVILIADTNSQLCRFQLPSNWITSVLMMPEEQARKAPFTMPYPCHIVYIVDVESPAIRQMTVHDPTSQLGSQFIQFSRKDKAGNGYALMNITFATKADSIPPEHVEKHRELVEQIWRSSSRELTISTGYSRPRQKSGFGELPVPSTRIATTPIKPNLPAERISQKPTGRILSSPSKRKNNLPAPNKTPWLLVWGVVSFIVLLFVLLVISARSNR